MEGVYLKYSWSPYSCGLGVLGDFKDSNSYTADQMQEFIRHSGSFEKWAASLFEHAISKAERDGTGYLCVGFIKTALCAKVQAWLDARYKTVFASEKRFNKNSDNEFWFVIYDAKERIDGGT